MSVAPAELTTVLLCLETAVVAADLVCVVLVAVLLVGCLTSGAETLVTVELLPEMTAGLLCMTTAALTDGGFTDAELTVVNVVAMAPVSLRLNTALL